jgi:hypothetical protein
MAEQIAAELARVRAVHAHAAERAQSLRLELETAEGERKAMVVVKLRGREKEMEKAAASGQALEGSLVCLAQQPPRVAPLAPAVLRPPSVPRPSFDGTKSAQSDFVEPFLSDLHDYLAYYGQTLVSDAQKMAEVRLMLSGVAKEWFAGMDLGSVEGFCPAFRERFKSPLFLENCVGEFLPPKHLFTDLRSALSHFKSAYIKIPTDVCPPFEYIKMLFLHWICVDLRKDVRGKLSVCSDIAEMWKELAFLSGTTAVGDGGQAGDMDCDGINAFSNVKCYKCGKLGHYSNKCGRGSGERGGKGGKGACFNCGESGHYSRECPKAEKGKGKGKGEQRGDWRAGGDPSSSRPSPNE